MSSLIAEDYERSSVLGVPELTESFGVSGQCSISLISIQRVSINNSEFKRLPRKNTKQLSIQNPGFQMTLFLRTMIQIDSSMIVGSRASFKAHWCAPEEFEQWDTQDLVTLLREHGRSKENVKKWVAKGAEFWTGTVSPQDWQMFPPSNVIVSCHTCRDGGSYRAHVVQLRQMANDITFDYDSNYVG
eukprot:6470795-Amphidinium_carterae.2